MRSTKVNKGRGLLSRRFLLGSAAVMAMDVAVVATAHAQDDVAEDVGDTITVTAQRREQNILEVPVAVTSYNGNTLETRRVMSLTDLNLLSTSVHVTGNVSNQMSNTPVRVRGFGTGGGGNGGFESAVGLIFDDVYRSRPGGVLGSFFDVGSLEVLRGPQGTLFGKNTTAGAIVIRSARPEFGINEFGVTGEIGNFSSYDVETYANFALGDNAAMRIAGAYNETDGPFERVGTGEATDPMQNLGVRFSLAWQPLEDLEVDLILDYLDTDTAGGAGIPTRIGNNDNGFAAGTYAPLAAAATGLPVSQAWFWDTTTTPAGDVDPFSYINYNNNNGSKSNENYGFTLKFDYDLNDSINVRSITALRRLDYGRQNLDIDFGPALLFGGPGRIGMNTFYNIDSFSQELLFSGDVEDFANGMDVDWTFGVHFFDETIDYRQFIGQGEQAADYGLLLANPSFGLAALPRDTIARPDALTQDVSITQEERSWGVFGQVDVGLTDSVSLIGGLRWNSVSKTGDSVNNLGATREEQFDYHFNNGRMWLALGGSATGSPAWQASTSAEELTYDVALQWLPTDDTQVYVKYAHGFKAGGINMNPDAIDGRPSLSGPVTINGRTFNNIDLSRATFAPEFVDAYEVGGRWSYPNGLLSVTGFWMDFQDLQVARFDGLIFQVVSAGSARSRGVEVENQYNISDRLSTNIGFTWMEARYGDDVVALTPGRALPNAPRFSSVVNVEYTQPISSQLEGFVNTNWTYYSKTFLADDASSTSLIGQAANDPYHVISLAGGVRSPDGDWEAGLWCENCFNAEYFTWAFNQPVHPGGAPMANPEWPRSWGVRLRKVF